MQIQKWELLFVILCVEIKKKTPSGVLIYITFDILSGKRSLCTLSVATSYLFLAVDFVRPFGAPKSYANAFIRYPFVPVCGFYTPLQGFKILR